MSSCVLYTLRPETTPGKNSLSLSLCCTNGLTGRVVLQGGADTAPVSHVYAPPEKHRLLNKPKTTRIPKRRIQCKKCEEFTLYSSSGTVRVNPKTGTEYMAIRAT